MLEDTVDCVVTLVIIYILVLIILDPVYFKWSVVKLLSQAAGVSLMDDSKPRRSASRTSRRGARKSGSSSSQLSRGRRRRRSSSVPAHCHRPAARRGNVQMYREIRVMEPILEEWETWRRGDKE